jgi:hypothetical protein
MLFHVSALERADLTSLNNEQKLSYEVETATLNLINRKCLLEAPRPVKTKLKMIWTTSGVRASIRRAPALAIRAGA